MTYNPYKVIPAVLVAVIKDGEVLLARRNNTRYMDGWYGLPGGHMDEGESLQQGAVRELKEEVNLNIKPDDLELFKIYQNQNTPGSQYIGFIFRTSKYTGVPESMEEKVEDVRFFDLDKLPEKLIPYHREALQSVDKPPKLEIIYTGFGTFDPSGK